MKSRKTPREKKELDYDKQRRTHWDSQKAARKAIPASRRAAHQIIRKRSSELIHASEGSPEDAPSAQELAVVAKVNRYRKYNEMPESLREHVEHAQQRRKS